MNALEIREKYLKEKRELEKKYKNDVNARLIEVGLGGLVRRKRDGKIGWIKVREYYFEFYPRTKKGEISMVSNGSVGDPEANFEPVQEGDT